jgi:hypothetical protein
LQTLLESDRNLTVTRPAYAFATGTPVVMQRYAPSYLAKDQWAFEFYDAKGLALGLIRERITSNPDIKLTPPQNLPAILRTAQNMVHQIQVSFARIDLYATRKRVVFGEFTPLPNIGKETFLPAFDQLLGQYWSDSLDQLGISYAEGLA